MKKKDTNTIKDPSIADVFLARLGVAASAESTAGSNTVRRKGLLSRLRALHRTGSRQD